MSGEENPGMQNAPVKFKNSNDNRAELERTIETLQRAYDLQKKAREEADQLLEEKSRELYQKNRYLEQALEKLSQQQAQLITQEKLASVGQLGASLAHELNNPNAFIQNNLHTLDDYILQLTNGLDEAINLVAKLTSKLPNADQLSQARQAMDKIRKASELDYIREDVPALMRETLHGTKRISTIANSLRYFANPDTSTRKPMDVNECLRQAQNLIHNKDQLAKITLDLEEVPKTLGLPMLLSQALANVIQNAIESQTDNIRVNIRSHQSEQSILIDITDHGVGIEENCVKELFQPFYSTKSDHNGLGLGIAKHIIEQHEGHINLQSKPGEGTCVRVSLPIIPLSVHSHTKS